jgi:hypothetical protein
MDDLKTSIEKDGQPYVDEAVIAKPKSVSVIHENVAYIFGSRLPRPITIGYNRVKLRWMKPDGKGGLVPK